MGTGESVSVIQPNRVSDYYTVLLVQNVCDTFLGK